MEYSIELKKGFVLRGMISSPPDEPEALIIFVHGLGEHIRRYESWSSMFRSEGIVFAGVDLPGHGLSDGARGNIRNFDQTAAMIGILYENISKTFPGKPVFLYGHSLGGGIVLDYLIRRKHGFRAAIVTAPWLRLAFEPSRFKLALASFMKHVLPGLVQPSGLVVEHLSHDSGIVEKYKSDPLVHDKISVSLFNSAMTAASSSLSRAGEINIPLLLMHGSGDMICSPEGSRLFSSGAKTAELKIWDGGYHELHNEPFREEVFTYILSWMKKVI
ncbi:MAG: lysophospholipase [Bacteroidales bacterium]|nr:lysophospholipase [Bacteroidales bacterium]